MKHLSDIIFSVIGLTLTAFIFPFIALAIILESGLPFLIGLERISAGKKVKIYKFRSMKKGAEKEKIFLESLNERNDGPLFKSKNDPRVTKVGKFLRRTRLDEFPQFFNVLKGDISLVGPRPHEAGEMLKYPPSHHFLFLAKAGLTGLSQITARPFLPFAKELELDAYYVKNQSLWLDLKIIFKTIVILFTRPDGI